MRTKLLLLVVFALSNTLFAQNAGDYRSKNAGPTIYPWNDAASWEVYVGPDADDWIPAQYYPGQISQPTFDVIIQVGHFISDPNVNQPFGDLVIDGTLYINTNQHVYLSSNSVTVTNMLGQIYFDGQGDLHLPVNTSLTVYPASGSYPGGLPNQMNDCSASKRIWFGSVLFSNCNGAGQPIAFQELMNANGSLVGIVNTVYNCNTAVLTPSHIGLLNSNTSANYQMTVKNPSGTTILSTPEVNYPSNLSYPIDISADGTYTITLVYKVFYQGTNNAPYINTRVIDLYSVFTWDGAKWTPFAPGITNRAVIDGNYNTATNGSFSACTLLIKNKIPKPIVVIAPNTYIETQSNIVNDGVLDIANSGSLVQKNNTATFTGSGTSTLNRVSRGMKSLDYVYWGSPIFDDPNNPNPQPLSLAATTHFDRFYTWNINGAQTGIWSAISATPAVGNGFIARVRPGHVSPNTTQMVFGGTGSKFNSGPITVTANVFDGGNVNTDSGNSVLLANPYPSAISANALFTNHPQIGKLLFWTSVTVYPGTGQYQVTDYATLTRTGVSTPPTTLNADITGLTPLGFIASGQGFFAQVTSDVNIVFNNSMRVRDLNSNTQFFRTANAETTEASTESEKHRIWINLNNGKDASRHMLVGYIENASNGFDPQYDATSFTTNEIDIYTVLEDKELAIQGRGLPFNDSDIIPLGYRVTNAGTYSITLSETDGLFKEYSEIYLKDKVTQTLHNLKKGSYEFHAQAGTYNNRFEIHFRESSKESNPIVSENNVLIYGANGALQVNSYGTNIQSVEVFDLVGKRIYVAQEINNDQFVSPNIKGASPFLIARVTLTNHQIITKKIIIQ